MNAEKRVRARLRSLGLTETYSDVNLSYGGRFGARLAYNYGAIFVDIVDRSDGGYPGFVEVVAWDVNPEFMSNMDRRKVAAECRRHNLQDIARGDKERAYLLYCEEVANVAGWCQVRTKSIALFDPTWYDSHTEITEQRKLLSGGWYADQVDPDLFVKGWGWAAVLRAVNSVADRASVIWDIE